MFFILRISGRFILLGGAPNLSVLKKKKKKLNKRIVLYIPITMCGSLEIYPKRTKEVLK